MARFITHSDNWSWQPPIPPSFYRGWYVENDDGEPLIGPFKTEAEAKEELMFAWWKQHDPVEVEQFDDDPESDFNDDFDWVQP